MIKPAQRAPRYHRFAAAAGLGMLLGTAFGCGGGSSDALTDAEQQRLAAPADVAAPPDTAQRTASGLAFKVLIPGTGTRHPLATDTVRVEYTGWQTNGVRFDSSILRGMPLEFALDGVIDGWTEGLQLMVEGEQRRFWIPEQLAYKGGPDGPSGMLVFDVELIVILGP